jgi:hypothetical protein
MGTKPLSPNSLVRLASCWDVPRADLAQMALAREEIPTSLGNANFLSWFWHYSNAVGGVTIHVRHCQAEQARRALVDARTKITEMLPPWTCSSCGQRVAGQWGACWQCGHWADGTPNTSLAEDLASQPAGTDETGRWWNVSRLVTVVASVALVVLLFKRGPLPPLMLAPCAFFLLLLLRQFEASPGRPSEPEGTGEPDDLSSRNVRATRSEVSRAIVRRAWQAAVLSILAFPPLGFYSMRLLWKLRNRNTPLSRADRWRCWTAFFLNIPAIALCLVFATALLSALLGALI